MKCLLIGLLAALPLLPLAAAPAPNAGDLLTGNLSVGYLSWVLKGRQGKAPETWTPAYLASLRRAGVTGIEDYIVFRALEPERDQPDWRFYRENLRRVRAAGMRYGVYPWLHFAPEWFRKSPDFQPYVCLEHGEPADSTSLWAPGTLALYDRFYAQLRKELGDGVSDIHASMPADYGEVGFPVGMTDWLIPQQHKHVGFWCGDPFARADFRAKMRARYANLDALNRAWGTQFADWEAVAYPPLDLGKAPAQQASLPDPQSATLPRSQERRRWLDFVGWYHDSQTEFTRKACAIIRKHFPNTPIQIKMGYGGEHVEYGVDITGVIRMAAREGIIVRSTHGKLPPFFYKRFSTACRFYGARLLTEPPSEVNRTEEVRRLFNDATNLSQGYFDYPANILRAADILRAYRPWLEGESAHIRVALFFPTSDHRLRPGERLPETLYDQAAALREVTDYDLVDENLVRDGALKDQRLLVMFGGKWLEQSTLDAIAAWVRAGGTLLVNASGPLANIEGETRTYQELVGPLAERAGDASFLTPSGAVPAHLLLDVGGPDDGRFLAGGWWPAEGKGAASRRWTQGEASFRVPVDPAKGLRVSVSAEQHVPPEKPARLRVNGQDAGELRFTQSRATVAVPAALLGGRRVALLTLVSETWRPCDRIPNNPDTRLLGLWVDRIEVTQPGGENAPALPSPGFTMDPARVLRECSRPVGKGRVVFFPLGPDEGPAYRQVIRHLVYFDGAPLHPPVDTEEDGVLAAVLPSKILFLNDTDQPVEKRVRLRPADFQGVPGPVPPERELTLSIPARALAAIRRADGVVLAPHPGEGRPWEDLRWWNPNEAIDRCAVKGDVLRVRVTGPDAQLTHLLPLGADAGERSLLFLRVRTDIAGGRLYWTTDRHPKMTDQTSQGFALPADGAWHDVRVDLSAAPAWEGVVRDVRLDLDAPAGYAEFQAIRLEKR